MKNQKKIKILIVPGTDFLRAYSGTYYLIEYLQNAGLVISVWLRCTKEDYNDYAKLQFPCTIFIKNLTDINVIRLLRGFVFRSMIFLRMLFSNRVLITESTYIKEAAIVKKIKGKKFILIQYCQELHIPEEYPSLKIAKIYERYAQVANLVIDVEPNRATIRKRRFNLKDQPTILYNTIPFESIPPKAKVGTLAKLSGLKDFYDLPVLLHMGGIGIEKPLERIIDAVAISNVPVFLLAFCNDSNDHIQRLQTYAESKLANNRFRILRGIPRKILLASAWEADIGVIDYSFSVQPTSNQKYCAPTKLYEFLALGLSILCSSNDSLRDIVEKEKIGICAVGDQIEDLGKALHDLIIDRHNLTVMKNRALKAYTDIFAYNKLCVPVINEKILPALKC